MARYLNVPQQNLVNMYTPLNVGFYSGILDKAQQNLNEATKIQSAYEDEIYNIKAFDQATKDAYINKAKQIIGNELDKEFVSPSNMARAVTRASKELAPWKNLNERQLELAKQYDEDKRRLGANFLGTDPRQTNLRDADGNLISPTQLNYVGINAEDLDKVFNLSEKGVLTSKYDRRVKSDIPYKIKFETVEGMSPKEIAQRYGLEGSEVGRLTEAQLQAVPQVMDIFNGDKKKAIEYLQNRNFANAGQYGQSVTSHYVDDDWGLYLAKKRLEAKEAQATKSLTPIYETTGSLINKPINVSNIMQSLTGGKTTVDWRNVKFNSSGNLSTGEFQQIKKGEFRRQKDWIEGRGFVKFVETPNYKEALNQLYTYKKMLSSEGINVKSDKEALELLQEAAQNSADFYSLSNESISDDWRGDNFNPFVTPGGDYKDASAAELEYYDSKKGKWKGVDAMELSKVAGLEREIGPKNVTQQLAKASDKTLDYSGNQLKLAGGIQASDGTTIPIRFNPANVKAVEYSEPYVQAKQVLLEPGKHKIYFPADGVGVSVTVTPTQVTNPITGENMIVNKFSNIESFGGNKDSKDNQEMLNRIASSPSPEITLINEARNYRDNLWYKHSILKKSSK